MRVRIPVFRRLWTYAFTTYGKATESLHLPTKKPPCFETQAQWAEYRRLANYSAGDGFTYCTDCSPGRQADMIREGRCKYPQTVFVKATGVLVGRRRG